MLIPLGSGLHEETRVLRVFQKFLSTIGQKIRSVHGSNEGQFTVVLGVFEEPDVVFHRMSSLVQWNVSAVVNIRVTHNAVEGWGLQQF
jgi:hypothetical protein